MFLKVRIFTKKCMPGGNTCQHLPPGIHFFVKIMSFELLYFLRITADLHETSQFYYFKYDKSDRKLHFLIKQIFKKIHCTGNSFIGK